MTKPRIAFFDIETSPNIVTTFDLKKDKNPIHHQNIQEERYIICASYKLAGSSKIHSFKVDANSPSNDMGVLCSLRIMFESVDAVVAHFGNGFDLPFINARLAFHNMAPLAPVVQIDTYRMARQKFLFNNNSLNYLSKFFGFGQKKSVGYSTWLGCLRGSKKDIDEMVAYNKHDVVLLEKVYNRLAVYCKPAINHALFHGKCVRCGSVNLIKRGFLYTKTTKRQRYKCLTCRGWQ